MAGTEDNPGTGNVAKVTGVSAIESILRKTLYAPENIVAYGPPGASYPEMSLSQPCMLVNRNVSPFVPGLDHIIPQESFRPRMGLAINFLYQYTATVERGSLETPPIVNPDTLSKETERLLNFKRYYLDAEPYMRYTFDTKWDYMYSYVLQSPENMNVFLNEFLNGYLTDVSVSRGRNDISTATITFKTVRNYPVSSKKSTTILYNTGLAILQQLLVPMLPIRIWARGRIYQNFYFPIYDGFIVAVNPTDSAGFAELQLTCKDILELARTTQENVNPAIVDVVNKIQKNDSVNILGSPFYGQDHFEIVRKVFAGGSLKYNISGMSEYFSALVDTDLGVITNANKVLIPGLGLVDKDRAQSVASALLKSQEVKTKFEEETAKAAAVSKSAKSKDGASGKQTTQTDSSKGSSSDAVDIMALAPFDFLVNNDPERYPQIPAAVQSKNDNVIAYDLFNVAAMLKCMQRPRKVIMWGSEMTPYRIFNIQSPDIFNSQFSSRLEILQQVASSVYYDFYSDGAGNIHYHPQRFANDYLTHDAIYFNKGFSVPYKVKDVWPGVQVLGPEELTSCAATLNYEQLATVLILRGKDPFINNTAQELFVLYGNAQHNEYLSRFGYRRSVIENSLFNFNFSLDPQTKDVGKAKVTFGDLLATTFLNYANAELYTVSCSLIFRPELQICKPIYFVEDGTVFYATAITHSISIGGDATTTVAGSYGRKAYEVPPDLNSFMLSTEGLYKLMGDFGDGGIDPQSFIRQLPVVEWEKYLDESQARALASSEHAIAEQTVLVTPQTDVEVVKTANATKRPGSGKNSKR